MKEIVTVIAEIKAKPGREEDVKKALLNLIGPTHAEEGCIDYDLHESLEQPGNFLFYENWVNDAALNAHLDTPHLRELKAKSESLFAGPVKITRWRRIANPKTAD